VTDDEPIDDELIDEGPSPSKTWPDVACVAVQCCGMVAITVALSVAIAAVLIVITLTYNVPEVFR
jgi:hypothetical protein